MKKEMSKVRARYDFIYQDTTKEVQKCTEISFKTYLLSYKQSIQLEKYIGSSTSQYINRGIFVFIYLCSNNSLVFTSKQTK